MIIIGLAAACFVILVAGFGVALLASTDSGRLNVVECGCLSWLFGVGVISLSLWLGGMFCSGLWLEIFATAIGIALAFVGWRLKRRAGIQFAVPLPRTTVEWILSSVIVLQIALMMFLCFKHTLGWDGLLNWEIKARYAFFGNGVLPASYYSDHGRGFSHPEYPLAIPFTELWTYLWMGEPHQFFVKIVFATFYAAGVLLLTVVVARLTSKRWLGLLMGALVPLVPFVTAGAGGAIVGYADFPIAIVYLGSIGYLLQFLNDGHRSSFYRFAIFLTLLPWMKSEGLILWSIVAVIGCAAFVCERKPRWCIWSVIPGLALIVSWKFYLAMMHAVRASDFAKPTFGLLRDHIDRVGAIVWILWAEMSDTSDWSIFWLLLAIALVYLLLRHRARGLIAAATVVAPIVLYSITYVFSAWPSYTAHMTSSIPRLLFQMVPAGWLAISMAMTLPQEADKPTPP